MPYRDPADKTQHMRDYREHRQIKSKRKATDRLHKEVSRIAAKMGVTADRVVGYRRHVFPKKTLLTLAANLPEPPCTKLSDFCWLSWLAYIAKLAFDGATLTHPGPQTFGTCFRTTETGEYFPLIRFIYRVTPAGPNRKDDFVIQVLLVEAEEGLIGDFTGQHSPAFAAVRDFLGQVPALTFFLKLLDDGHIRWHEIRPINPDSLGIDTESRMMFRTNEAVLLMRFVQLLVDGEHDPARHMVGFFLPVSDNNFYFIHF